MLQSILEKGRSLFGYKIVRYGFTGGIATLIHIGVASIYIYSINGSLFQSNVTGFLVAYIFSYTVQSLYVFEHAIELRKALRYFLVQFASLLVSIALSSLFEDFNSYFKTLLVVVFMPIITYITHIFWTFKD